MIEINAAVAEVLDMSGLAPKEKNPGEAVAATA
jgi:hypothetical protein